MADKGTDFEPVNLQNVAEGELERQFSECLLQVIAAFDEPQEYEPSGHMIKSKVNMVVEFQKNLETGAVLVGVRASFAPPKRRAALRAAFIQDGTILVEHAEQLGLLNNVTPITRTAEEIDE